MGQTRMADKIEKQVAKLLAKAEAGDSAPLEDGLTLPEEIARRQDRPEQLRAANEVIRARAKERYERGLAEFQAQEEERAERAERTGKKPRGRAPKPPGPGASPKEKMKNRLQTRAGRELYAQRKQTIEPIFGIIKETLGFRRFSLRSLKKVGTEWTLVTLAYNLKRLFHMGAALSDA